MDHRATCYVITVVITVYCVFEERNKESAAKTIACYGATRHTVIETGADFKLFLNHREFVLIEFRFVSHLPFAFFVLRTEARGETDCVSIHIERCKKPQRVNAEI